MKERPKVICLCGSTRFKKEFIEANYRETMAGRIVLSVGWFSHSDGHIYTPSAEEKAALDELHLRKIDLADEVLVIDPVVQRCPDCARWWRRDDRVRTCSCGADPSAVPATPYLGESTRREIAYAEAHGKPVRYLNPV